MNLKNSLYSVLPKIFDKEIELPTSKSHSNRALIKGAIRGNNFSIDKLSTSSDVLTLLSCLRDVGVRFTHKNDSIIFHNSFPACEIETKGEIIELQSGDGGTTNRFLLALLSRGKKTYRLFPSEKMSKRPMDDLFLPLKKLGVSLEVNSEANTKDAWVCIQGPAHIDFMDGLKIDCRQSTQFASAMMLAFSDTSLSFELINLNASEDYIKMTKNILEMTRTHDHYVVPIDFSSLSYPLSFALLSGSILIKNAFALDPFQADSKFIELIQKWGGDVEWTPQGLKATSKNELKSFEVDGAQFPDLVPALVFLAAHIEGESILTNLSVLRYKESDRVEQLIFLLNLFSVQFEYKAEREELIIHGRRRLYPPANVYPARDHRIVMTAYLFLRKNSGGGLAEIDCVNKSFPDFFECMN